MRLITPTFFLACLAACVPALAQNPHESFSRPGGCADCHVVNEGESEPAKPVALNSDVISICLKCHDRKMVFGTHPVEIKPEMKLPEGMHLSEDGVMTCATCHAPHSGSEADVPYVAESFTKRLFSLFTLKSGYKTYFLRGPNDSGQLCKKCHRMDEVGRKRAPLMEVLRIEEFVGSKSCQPCHGGIYDQWKKTPHARMVGDAKANPAVVRADFTKKSPFPRESVVLALGTHWSQRYVEEVDGELYVKGAGWNVKWRKWESVAWEDKPWGLYCAGCHTTGYIMEEKPRYVETGIGCEACHGPGKSHAQSGDAALIVNPARLPEPRRQMVCHACHTTGHDLSGQFQFPLGYLPGQDLSYYFKGLMPKPGQSDESFYGDGSYEDRARQYEWWVGTVMDRRTEGCSACNDFRSRGRMAPKEKMTLAEYCQSCHDRLSPKVKEHAGGTQGCLDCHKAAKAATTGNPSIHDHKFLFGPPKAG